jgi:hypothetical protein
MNKQNKQVETFGADEVLKPDTLQVISRPQAEKVELKPVKFYKTYELNEEGLKLYGMYKKQQHLNMIKWSLLGTCIGCLFAAIVDISFRKMKFRNKDIVKALLLVGSIGLFSFHGVQASTMQFRAKQRELSQLYGKEVDDPEDSE